MPEQIVRDTAAAAVVDSPDATTPSGASEEPPRDELVVDELLVEDVSIDGMCGVY